MRPQDIFWSQHYIRHNQRRQEHLASLGLGLAKRSVLEVGAGIGDHTTFFLDRECSVTVTEPQEQNLTILKARYPQLEVRSLDLNEPPGEPMVADVVYCYGVLYHLNDPREAIRWMSRCSSSLMLLETCVSAAPGEELDPFDETVGQPDNAANGMGCRPTRGWVRRELGACFEHVYMPLTQPWHEEFPLDWSVIGLADRPLIRSIFVASRTPLSNPLLTEELPMRQTRAADG
jgi:ubiquinone/menaquinone biosynthesis C-methylase UbiE